MILYLFYPSRNLLTRAKKYDKFSSSKTERWRSNNLQRGEEMSNLIELPERYKKLASELLNDSGLFGIILDDSAMLRDLVRLASEIKEIDQIADLVLGNLSGIWTFNHKGLECGQDFPESIGLSERTHWDMITIEVLPPRLSSLLRERIGNCATYSLTLAICLHSVGYENVAVCWGKMPHATEPGGWAGHLCVKVGDRLLDLTQRSHGAVECPGTYIEEGQLPL